MGRPLSKHLFGTGAGNKIKVRAKIGSFAEGDGTIIRQRNSSGYQVQVGANVGVCHLVDKADGTLAAGEMTISVIDATGVISRVKRLKAHRLTTFAGAFVRWAFDAAMGRKVRISAQGSTLAPVITIGTQPAAATVTHPATATFTVAATVTNGATLSYQWTKGGSNIQGATSASYTTPATATTDSGSVFACVVGATGGAASVTSSNATLTVN